MDAQTARDRAAEAGFRGGGTAAGQLAALDSALRDQPAALPEDWPAIAYGLVQAARQAADVYEAWLIRTLREHGVDGTAMTWGQVAEAVDSHLGSRQAAQAKWKRLIDVNRREYGGPGRGGRPRTTPNPPTGPQTAATAGPARGAGPAASDPVGMDAARSAAEEVATTADSVTTPEPGTTSPATLDNDSLTEVVGGEAGNGAGSTGRARATSRGASRPGRPPVTNPQVTTVAARRRPTAADFTADTFYDLVRSPGTEAGSWQVTGGEAVIGLVRRAGGGSRWEACDPYGTRLPGRRAYDTRAEAAFIIVQAHHADTARTARSSRAGRRRR